MRKLGLAALALAGISTAALAKDDQAQPQTEKLICKRQGDADTGSHFAMPKKVCRTKAEWKEMEDGAAQAMEGLRQNGSMSGRPTSSTGGGPH